jgi:hypothetical protein
MSPTQPRLWVLPLAAGPTRAADPAPRPSSRPRPPPQPAAPAPTLFAAPTIIQGCDADILCALVPEPGRPLSAAALARIAADPAQPARTREIAAWVRSWR